jgi:threonine dehydrogenase-like Zn-dependent dehydrogenase
VRDVSVLEVSQRRREFCQRHLQVGRCLDGAGDPVVQLEGMLGGDLPTTVFDATGNKTSMVQALRYVSNGGKLVLVGLVQAEVGYPDPEMHRRELTLLRSRNATWQDFAWAIRMVEQGRIDLAPWITHRAAADAVPGEFASWLDPARGVVKAVVEF